MDIFEVGTTVRILATGEVGTVYAIRNGKATGKRIYSVKIDKGSKNPGHAFPYEGEIEAVDDEDSSVDR